MKLTAVLLLCLFCLSAANVPAAPRYSTLWGESGENWSPESRLPDFSFAGYHCGEDRIPLVRSVTDVRRFGARGDGKTDDSAAFIKAIEATEKDAILIPAGRYHLTDIIRIRKPGIVLRGVGPDKTVLFCSKGLEQVKPNPGHTTSGRPTSNYSWSGGYLWVQGSYRNRIVSRITSETKRGARTITVQKTAGLTKGQRILIALRDDGKRTLLNHIYSGDPGDTRKMTRPITPRMVSRIVSIKGNTVTLERPLRFDIRASWSPTLQTFDPSVREVGIEDLTIEFPSTPYKGHFTEVGFNGIAMYGVCDCWVRNVHVRNADSGIFASGVFCTLEKVVLSSQRTPARSTTGHHGITLGTDNLCHDFDFQTHFIHDFTVTSLSAGNVVKNGRGTDLSLDHHKRAPYENLFCNIHIGRGGDMWRCGGGASLGKHCAARGTFWCIRADRDQSWPPDRFGPPSMNFVGIRTKAPSRTEMKGKWFEAIPPDQLQPPDLHRAQLRLRLSVTK